MNFIQQILANPEWSKIMSKMNRVYGLGQALIPVLPPPLPFENAPTSNQTNYEIGQVVFTPPNAPTAFYMYGGGGNWVQLADSDGPIESVVGTTNQVSVNTSSNVATVSLPSAITTPGSLTTTTTLAAGTSLSSGTTMTAGTGITSTTGNIVASAGNITATLGNIAASAGSVSAATTVTAGTGITATTGNIAASSGNVSASGTVTGGTGVTATTGDVTSTAGNLVAAGSGKGLSLPVATGSGAASGTVNCNGRVGSVTFTGVSVAQNADISLTMGNTSITGASTRCVSSLSGATTNSALTVKSYTPSANQVVWVVTNGGTATSTADITFDFIVLN
jgi:hypothetical protein